MRASGPRLNLNTTSVATLSASRSSITTIDEANVVPQTALSLLQ
jgi:hypothetical protein